MVTISTDIELAAWDAARAAPAAQRAEAILAAFGIAGQLSLGARDAELLDIYADNYGPCLDGMSRCPDCGTDVELTLELADLKASIAAAHPIEPLLVGGERIQWRLPTGADLAAVANCDDPEDGARTLLARCLGDEQGVGVERCEQVRDMLAEHVLAADPYTELMFSLVCPACASTWKSSVDVGEFVWATMHARAQRLLREVDALARYYGWSEAQILELTQARREAYLELVRDG